MSSVAQRIEGIVEDRNYLKSSFENGTITGWTEVSVALTSGLPTGTPTISSTAASSLALSATSVTPLSGSRSLLVDVPSALTAGHGFISDEFTLDRMDLGKVLTVTFDYERVTGTYNFSGTLGSQTWMVYIYDATLGAANWIQPAGFLGMNQSSGPGRVRATFQSSVTAGQKYRVAVIASQAAAGASSIEFDNFTASRQTAPIGPVVTDWVSYTPTGSWTGAVTYSGRYRRVGDSIQVIGQIACSGAPTGGLLTINLPTGISFDTAKIPGSGSEITLLGVSNALDAGAAWYAPGHVGYNNATSVILFVKSTTNSYQEAGLTPTVPYTFASGDLVQFHFTAPISGWSSNVQLSNDTDTRVVSAFGTKTSGTHTSTGNWQDVSSFDSSSTSTHGNFNTATGVYTVAVSGDYLVSSNVGFASNSVGFRGIRILKTGGVSTGVGVFMSPISGAQTNIATSGIVRGLVAGDTLYMQAYQSSGGNLNYATSTDVTTNFSISRLSGPSVVAASETVAAVYQTGAGQSIPNNTVTPIVYGTKVFDTHSAMNASTGVYTVPVSGTFEVKASHYFGTAITATATDVQTIVQVDGISMFGSNLTKSGTVAAPLTTLGSFLVKANAGQTIRIALLQSNSTASAQSLLANVTFNWISINRVGN